MAAPSSLRRTCFLLATLVLLTGSSCMQTPQEKLLGRWYNSGVSIRFRKDGSVLYNSQAGRAIGRYYFNPQIKDPAQSQATPNLVLDVVRNDRRVQMKFEAELMSRDRIRLTYFPESIPGQPSSPPRASILRRADDAAPTPPSVIANADPRR